VDHSPNLPRPTIIVASPHGVIARRPGSLLFETRKWFVPMWRSDLAARSFVGSKLGIEQFAIRVRFCKYKSWFSTIVYFSSFQKS
jgi:hypothetical protein